jgi:hypothetical protein
MTGAQEQTPESLGRYLTWLVEAQRQTFPGCTTELLAAGMRATMAALMQTQPMGLHEQVGSLAMLLTEQWLGWPVSRR